MAEPLVLLGRLVTFDRERPELKDGALYIGADELIHGVNKRSEPAPPGFESARRVDTKGCVYPGLIDLHSHVVYNILPLWSPPGTSEPFVNRKDWPRHGDYEGTVSDPANALGALAGKAHLKYCEVKAVVGGTTAIQGSAKMAYPYEGWLVRNVEYETFKTGKTPSTSPRCRSRTQRSTERTESGWRPATPSSTTSPRAPSRRCSRSTS